MARACLPEAAVKKTTHKRMQTFNLLLAFLVSAAVASFMLPRIILISFRKRLFDTIDRRKVHSGIVPRLGGVAFVPSMTGKVVLYSYLRSFLYVVRNLHFNQNMTFEEK